MSEREVQGVGRVMEEEVAHLLVSLADGCEPSPLRKRALEEEEEGEEKKRSPKRLDGRDWPRYALFLERIEATWEAQVREAAASNDKKVAFSNDWERTAEDMRAFLATDQQKDALSRGWIQGWARHLDGPRLVYTNMRRRNCSFRERLLDFEARKVQLAADMGVTITGDSAALRAAYARNGPSSNKRRR